MSTSGEGNGTPLQYSCLENPRDGGAWWAAVYGVAQSRTRLSDLAAAAAGVNFIINTVLPCYCLYRKIEMLSEQLVLFEKTEMWLEAAFLVLVLNVSFRNPVPATEGQKSPDPAAYTHM